MIKIKICGMTNEQDALWAVNLGADFVGFNFYPQSPRKISVKNAKAIAAKLPPFVPVVGIFVNEPAESLAKIVKSVPLKYVQLHGSESPDDCRAVKALGVSVIKVVGLNKPLETSDVEPFNEVVDYFLFDHQTPDVPGGTGETFTWEWLQNANVLTKPWFLAGGLTPENIGKAVTLLHPPLVDVCSGVERLPTRKDFEAMKKFIQNARSAR
jgi:phosphoribosylanthranilate isomerase